MSGTPESLRYLSQRAGKRFRWSAFVVLIAMVLLAVVAAICRSGVELRHVVAEEGLLELLHPWNWVACAALASIGCLRPFARRDVCFFFWIGVLALLGAMRELDYHVLLNPDNIHHLGLNADHAVRFRLDWWADGSTAVLPRVVWGVIFLTLLACLTVPLMCARVRWKRLVLGLDPFAWVFGAGFGCVGLGWVFDDIILRMYVTAPEWGKLAEEGVETLGQILVLGSLAMAIRRPPHARAMAMLKPEPPSGPD